DLIWEDRLAPERTAQVVWFDGCTNPIGDLYYNCYAGIGKSVAAQVAAGGFPDAAHQGNHFKFSVPADIIDSRRGVVEVGQPRYGLTTLFFALCAGTLQVVGTNGDATAVPLECLDENQRQQGPDAFVVGYTSVYSFKDISNQNPIVTDFEFNGATFKP